MGPASSTGSPITFMMRPSVPGPTGTAIGRPVSCTDWPRTRPSVESMAMQRTVDSPKCCATSRTRREPRFSISSEFRIAGRCPSKCTSTTAPITCATRPIVFSAMFCSRSRPRPLRPGEFNDEAKASSSPILKRLGARNDLDEFLRDHRLTRPVVEDRLLLDHLAGISGRRIHGAHLGAHLGRHILEKRAIDLHRDVARQERIENLALVRLELVKPGHSGLGALLGRAGIGGNDALRRRDLLDDRTEARIEKRRYIELAVAEALDRLIGDALRIAEADLLHAAQIDHLENILLEQSLEDVVTLLADADEFDALAFADERIGAIAREARDRGIERAAQSTLGRADDQEMALVRSGAGKKRRSRGGGNTGCEVGEDALHARR